MVDRNNLTPEYLSKLNTKQRVLYIAGAITDIGRQYGQGSIFKEDLEHEIQILVELLKVSCCKDEVEEAEQDLIETLRIWKIIEKIFSRRFYRKNWVRIFN